MSLNAAGPALEATGAAVPEPAARTEEAASVVSLWTRTAEAELPEVADDAQQGRLLAARAAGRPVVLTYHCDLRLPPGVVNLLAGPAVAAAAESVTALSADFVITSPLTGNDVL